MDGSYNNPVGGGSGGGVSGVSAGGMAPGRSVGGATPGVPGGIYSGGATRGGAMPGGYSGGMAPGGMISSGTGDVVLSSGGGRQRNWKKIGLIGGAVAAVVLVVALLVVGLSGRIGGGVSASNTREAFNLYANYFLTGEVSKEDIVVMNDDGEGEDGGDDYTEYVGEPEVIEYEPTEIVTEVGEDGEVIASMIAETVEEEIEEPSSESYFDKMLMMESDERVAYMERLLGYYDEFQARYLNELGQDEDDADIGDVLERYSDELVLVIEYFGGASFSQDEVFREYALEGEAGAENLIEERVSIYDGLDTVGNGDFYDLMSQYGQRILALAISYGGHGCLTADGDLDLDCALSIEDGNIEAVDEARSEVFMTVSDIVDNCLDDLYAGVYSLANLLYLDGGED